MDTLTSQQMENEARAQVSKFRSRAEALARSVDGVYPIMDQLRRAESHRLLSLCYDVTEALAAGQPVEAHRIALGGPDLSGDVPGGVPG